MFRKIKVPSIKCQVKLEYSKMLDGTKKSRNIIPFARTFQYDIFFKYNTAFIVFSVVVSYINFTCCYENILILRELKKQTFSLMEGFECDHRNTTCCTHTFLHRLKHLLY